MTLYRAIDVETTGLAENDGRVCEVGIHDCRLVGAKNWSQGRSQDFLVNPGEPIPPAMSAIHHIVDDDVAGAQKWHEIEPVVLNGADVLVAHHAAFERAFINTDKPWICTWKIACRAYPDLESHSLQFLRYALDIPVDKAMAGPPHRALPDAYVCAQLLMQLAKQVPLERMIEWSLLPCLIPRCTHGKHSGLTYQEIAFIDPGYLQWMLRQDFSEDVMFTAAHWLGSAEVTDDR
jgi:exodeoxyribonuclease X